MELSPIEKIQLDNDRAHLEIISGNIRDATKEIESLFIDKKNLQSEVINYKNDIGLLIQNKNSLTKELSSINDEIVSRKLEFKKIEDESKEKINLLNKKIKILDSKVASMNQRLLDGKNDITNIVKEINELKENKTKEESELHEIQSSILQSKKEEQKCNKELRIIQEEIEHERVYLEKFRRESELERKKTSVLMDEELKKIEIPTKILKVKEKELAIKERNFNIIVNRFRKNFEKTYPGQQLKI